jgi:hypothetical protein
MDEFRKHSWAVTDANLRNPCEVEIVPGQAISCVDKRLFVRPPQFARKPYPGLVGLPYDWGGSDSIKTFDNKLARGFLAGNIGATFWGGDHYSVTAGVDCSGLVKNVWELDDHILTADLPKATTGLTELNQMRIGDVFLLAGHHVVLFREQVKPDGASLALKVTEASSRCGSVCDSLYEIDFLHGYKLRRRK